ncbi:MAG: phosphoribosylanthranilate isomerase [Armatimonadia bacterium]
MSKLLKVCGLSRIADLRHAQRCGADFVGLVVEAPGSLRAVTLEQAEKLARLAPGQTVAVVMSDDPEFLRQVVRRLRPRALQLHVPKAAELVRELKALCPVWVAVGLPPKGIGASDEEQVAAEMRAAAEAGAEMIVLDTTVKGQTGGTGQTSDWEQAARLVALCPIPVLLAGGICPENAARALLVVNPAGLDASTRLERCPREKDAAKVEALAASVKGRTASP